MNRPYSSLLSSAQSVLAAVASPRESLRQAILKGQKSLESAIMHTGDAHAGEETGTSLDRLGSLAKLKLIQLEIAHASLEQIKELTGGASEVAGSSEAQFGVTPFRESSLRAFFDTSAGSSETREAAVEAEMAELESLRLRGEQLTDEQLAELVEFENLELLALNGLGLTDSSLTQLAKLTKLRMLDLSENPELADAGKLSTLSRLELLSLDATGVDDGVLAALEELENLRWLSLADTRLSDGGLRVLQRFRRLESLNLSGTQIGEASVDSIVRLPRLKRLSVSGTAVTDEWLAALAQSSSTSLLSSLPDAAESIAEEGRKGLADLAEKVGASRLKSIPVVGKIAEAGLELLESGQLQMLDLERTQITDAGLESLKLLTGLTWLNLDDTAITDVAVDALSELNQLESLGLIGTTLSDGAVDRLQEALPRCEVYR